MSMNLSKLQWYMRRLQAMSPTEVVHRLFEAAKKHSDRILGAAFYVPPAHPFKQCPCMSSFRKQLDAWDVPEVLLKEWEEQASQLQTKNFFLLGQLWPQHRKATPWHLDPVSGREWPCDQFCFGIDYRHARAMGDIKLVWELNRLQHIQPVAALAFKRRDQKLAVLCLEEIENWIDANPPFMGVNWCSGIELALRTMSILVVLTFVGEYLSCEQSKKIRQSIETHGIWLARYISAYSSANNHRTAEGLGLFAIGALCPELPKARKWKETGWRLLEETAHLQILPDGVGAEQTLSYTAVVLEMLLLGLSIANNTGFSVPEDYVARIALGGNYLRWFADSKGHFPHIGDNDNARVIGVYTYCETYIRSVLGSIAAAMDRPDLVPPCLKPHLRQALFGFPPIPTEGPFGVHSFKDGGYTVGRHKVFGRDYMVAIDHGYLGYLSIAAHGHADALSLWLHVEGQPILVDAGTYLYHSGGDWRAHFRGTGAHNTLLMEGRSSSQMAGNFNWSHKAEAKLVDFSAHGDCWQLEASHDGYKRRFNATHYRRFVFDAQNGITVFDRIDGNAARFVEISYLFHPDLTVIRDNEEVLVKKGEELLLRIQADAFLEINVYDSNDIMNCGWYSETFNVKMPTTRLVFSGLLPPDYPFVTRFLFPREPVSEAVV